MFDCLNPTSHAYIKPPPSPMLPTLHLTRPPLPVLSTRQPARLPAYPCSPSARPSVRADTPQAAGPASDPSRRNGPGAPEPVGGGGPPGPVQVGRWRHQSLSGVVGHQVQFRWVGGTTRACQGWWATKCSSSGSVAPSEPARHQQWWFMMGSLAVWPDPYSQGLTVLPDPYSQGLAV